MRTVLRVALSAFLSSFAPPVLFTALSFALAPVWSPWLITLFLAAWVVSLAHIVVLGIPAFLLLQRKRLLGWVSIGLTGFATGSIPIGVIAWPLGRLDGYSSGGNWFGSYVTFIQDGVPTAYGWLSYLLSCAQFGLLGVACALLFWRILARLGP